MKKTKTIEPRILIDILTRMLKIRLFEEQVAKISSYNEIQTPVHLYIGQEAIAASVCASLNDNDFVYSTHRNHGHYIAKGGDINCLMAEIFCKEDGCSRGRGGSMHTIDKNVGFMASSAIVAGSMPIAVGSALAAKMKDEGQVAVAFFGDGATDEGVFYECINLAVLYKLPIIFICENNAFATHQPDFLRQSNINVADRIRGFNINAECVSGNNPYEVYSAVSKMVKHARDLQGPALLECKTFRWLSHAGHWQDLDVGYRKKKDVELWMNKCPITLLSADLIANGIISEADIIVIKSKLLLEIEESVRFAHNSPSPDPRTIGEGLFSK